jgi:ABC-type Fe3+/spermidine/putrescine transport system ATPase subunit
METGIVSFNGQDLRSTPPHLRDFGLVFQDYALFPHLDVNDNVSFGLRMRRIGQDGIKERVVNSLKLVNLDGFGNRKVTTLSGGEQQRVALARALAIHPRLLMLDEPLGALDRTLREDLLNELRRILHQTKIPAIYVTHDQEEAFTIADRVLILHNGEIVRQGTPAEVWANPVSVFVAEFLGLGNIVGGEVAGGTTINGWKVKTSLGLLSVGCAHKHSNGDKVKLLVRPQWVREAANIISGVVTDVIFQQDRFKITLDNGLYVHLMDAPEIGSRISARVDVECLT